MSPDTRPTPSQMTRRLIVLASAVFAVLVAQLQILLGWGQSQAQFAAQGDSTLRVAGYAFAIWGAIYMGLLIYAVRQVLPRTGETEVLNRLGWPSAVALLGIGAWIPAAAFDARWATVVLIFASAAVLVGALAWTAPAIRALGRFDRDRMLTVWPLAALAGWLTVAAPLNLLTVLTAEGQLPAVLPPAGWALLAVGAAAVVALLVTARLRVLAYPLPVAWGLLGAFVAEQAGQPAVAFPALTAAVVVLVGGLVLVFRLRPGGGR